MHDAFPNIAPSFAADTALETAPTRSFLLPSRVEDNALLLAHMGRWRWALNDRAVYFTSYLFDIFDLDLDRFRPSLNSLRPLISSRDMGRLFLIINRLIQEAQEGVIDFTLKHPARNDVEFFVRCYACAERDSDGNVVALYGLLHDITREKRNQAALQNALEETEAANRAKSRFLATMSHELRTPLNAIIGFSEMMQRQLLGPIGTEKYLDYIDGIRQSGEHLLDLISDILDMSKIEAGKYTLDPEPVNLAKLTRLAISMVEGRARESCVDLGCNDFGDDIQITADRRAILQIMLNILSNAIKFTDPGGSVRLELTPTPDNKIKFSVTDTGIGIPADMLDVITKPFEQAANQYTRAHEGSGLGLAITKELTLMHGGHLDIRSTVGKGTTVSITLPRDIVTETTALSSC